MNWCCFKRFALAFAALGFLNANCLDAQGTSTVYFLAAGPRLSEPQDNPNAAEYESFVVPVTDAAQIAEIRSLIQHAKYPVVNVALHPQPME